jgi:hypothetical protein
MDYPRLQPADRPREISYVREGSAGHLQRNPSGERQGAGDGQQNSARTEVQGGGKFKKFLAPIVAASHKYRNGQGQSFPVSTLFCDSPTGHAFPWSMISEQLSLAPYVPNGAAPID